MASTANASAFLLPRVLDLAMRNHALDSYRRSAITSARGLVLEIGVGSGLNLSLYGATAGHVVGLDPSCELLRLARERAAQALVPISLITASAEDGSTLWPLMWKSGNADVFATI